MNDAHDDCGYGFAVGAAFIVALFLVCCSGFKAEVRLGCTSSEARP